MVAHSELDAQPGTSLKVLCRSPFALIPILNWKKNRPRTERKIIRIIRNSDICKSNPILKTLLIENVRICCVVVESSGKQSIKILCASAPYILALISKANPKLENLLKSERISSCLNFLQQSDLEYLLGHVCDTTMVIHRGVKKYYPTLRVGLIKYPFLCSEKAVLNSLNLMLRALQSFAEFFYDNLKPFINCLLRQNRELATFVSNYFPLLIASAVKSASALTIYSQKTVIFIFQFIRKLALWLSRALSHICENSAPKCFAKKLCLDLKACVAFLRSTVVYTRVVQRLCHAFYSCKPYVVKCLQETFELVKHLIQKYFPLLKDCVLYAFKEGAPLLRMFIDDNVVEIINVFDCITAFLSENSHRIKSFCCQSCRFCYLSAVCLFNAFQAVLPRIIELSSTVIIYFITCSNFVVDCCIHLCKAFCHHVASVLKNHKELFSHLWRGCISIYKILYELTLEAQPYMALIFRNFFGKLAELIHTLAPTLLGCLQEMNSSLFYASREVVSKSCLAVKHILPSFYYTARIVLPPTVHAAREVIKSSASSVVLVYPAIFRSLVVIRPDLEEGIVVLLTDGNKACIEIVSASFSASCQVKDVAKTVSRNLPILGRALREVLTTTSYAALEVSVTSLRAKSRMLKDLKRASDVASTSLMLAEQEIYAVYMDAVFEINSVIMKSSESGSDRFFKKYVINSLSKLCKKYLSKIFSIAVDVSSDVAKNSAVCFQDLIKMVVAHVCSFLFFTEYLWSRSFLCRKVCKVLCSTLLSSFCSIFRTSNSQIQRLCEAFCSNLSDVNIRVIHNVCIIMSKVWYASKSNVKLSWHALCSIAPEVWTAIQDLSSLLWDYSVEKIPAVWLAWKSFCSVMWELVSDLAPYVWQYFATVVPVLWSSIRVFVRNVWCLFIDSTNFVWQRVTCLSSLYWTLSNTYLPGAWYAGCAETRKGWKVSCYLIENCWTLTMETCLLSWEFLHRSVSKSWRSGLAVTKTAYFVLAASGSVLRKGFCLHCRSKDCACVMLEKTRRINYLSFNYFHLSKLRNLIPLPSIAKGFNLSDAEDNNIPSKRLRFKTSINNYICTVVKSCPYVNKLLKCEAFIPSKMFWKYSVE